MVLTSSREVAEIFEIEIVLQRRLKVVRRGELHQVVRLGRFWKRPQANDPVRVLLDFFAHQRRQKLAFSDTRDGGVQRCVPIGKTSAGYVE